MANNVTNPNVLAPPSESQVNNPAVKGQHVVQALPLTAGVAPKSSTSVTGSTIPYTYDDKKGKGNN